MKVISSVVVHGAQIGRRIGFPTANMNIEEGVSIDNGVYASTTEVDNKEYISITNIGLRPTVCGKQRLIETHLLDFSGDLYGKTIKVSLCLKIRDERKFNSLDELKTQLEMDTQTVRMFFSKNSLK
ncbi:MAG: riboflavin kinase [Alistipes sp.]|nr:riboflavin kinase [Candidatus Alistipes equi]